MSFDTQLVYRTGFQSFSTKGQFSAHIQNENRRSFWATVGKCSEPQKLKTRLMISIRCLFLQHWQSLLLGHPKVLLPTFDGTAFLLFPRNMIRTKTYSSAIFRNDALQTRLLMTFTGGQKLECLQPLQVREPSVNSSSITKPENPTWHIAFNMTRRVYCNGLLK